MTLLRSHFGPAYVAGVVFAVPYAVLASLIAVPLAGIDVPTSIEYRPTAIDFMLFAVGFDIVLGLVPGIFFVTARYGWKRRDSVVADQLFGWPVGSAVLASFLFGVLSRRFGFPWLVPALLSFTALVAFGLAASRMWLWLAYSDGEVPNQSSEPTLSSVTPPAGQESRPR